MSVTPAARLVQAGRLGLRIYSPPALPEEVELEPAPPRRTAAPAAPAVEAHRAGLEHGGANLPRVEYSATPEVQHRYDMGYQIGQQKWYANRGERDALLGWPRRLPAGLDSAYAAEYLTGWDRGRELFDNQVAELRRPGSGYTPDDRDMWPAGNPG